jgi:nucleoid-associated protein YgaU
MQSFKNSKFLILLTMISIYFTACISTSDQQTPPDTTGSDSVASVTAPIEAPMDNKAADNTNSNVSDTISEGVIPPVNQNVIVPYYVQKKDNLSKLAEKIYGDKNKWKQLAAENNISNPNQIYVGDVIYYKLNEKNLSFYKSQNTTTKNKIVVKKGDTLSSISKIVYGQEKEWRNLWKANPQIMNPDHIKPGEVLIFHEQNLQTKSVSPKNSVPSPASDIATEEGTVDVQENADNKKPIDL